MSLIRCRFPKGRGVPVGRNRHPRPQGQFSPRSIIPQYIWLYLPLELAINTRTIEFYRGWGGWGLFLSPESGVPRHTGIRWSFR